MLRLFINAHVAPRQHSPETERRLLRFGKAKKNGNGGLESEQGPESPKGPEINPELALIMQKARDFGSDITTLTNEIGVDKTREQITTLAVRSDHFFDQFFINLPDDAESVIADVLGKEMGIWPPPEDILTLIPGYSIDPDKCTQAAKDRVEMIMRDPITYLLWKNNDKQSGARRLTAEQKEKIITKLLERPAFAMHVAQQLHQKTMDFSLFEAQSHPSMRSGEKSLWNTITGWVKSWQKKPKDEEMDAGMQTNQFLKGQAIRLIKQRAEGQSDDDLAQILRTKHERELREQIVRVQRSIGTDEAQGKITDQDVLATASEIIMNAGKEWHRWDSKAGKHHPDPEFGPHMSRDDLRKESLLMREYVHKQLQMRAVQFLSKRLQELHDIDGTLKELLAPIWKRIETNDQDMQGLGRDLAILEERVLQQRNYSYTSVIRFIGNDLSFIRRILGKPSEVGPATYGLFLPPEPEQLTKKQRIEKYGTSDIHGAVREKYYDDFYKQLETYNKSLSDIEKSEDLKHAEFEKRKQGKEIPDDAKFNFLEESVRGGEHDEARTWAERTLMRVQELRRTKSGTWPAALQERLRQAGDDPDLYLQKLEDALTKCGIGTAPGTQRDGPAMCAEHPLFEKRDENDKKLWMLEHAEQFQEDIDAENRYRSMGTIEGNIETISTVTLRQIDEVFREITSMEGTPLQHEIGAIFGVEEMFGEEHAKHSEPLQEIVYKVTTADRAEASVRIHAGREWLGKLKECRDALKNWPPFEKLRITDREALFDATLPNDQDGIYDQTDGKMHLHTRFAAAGMEDELEDLYEHERWHAIADVLTRKSRVLPRLITQKRETLNERYGESRVNDILSKLTDATYKDIRNQTADDLELRRRKLLDEAGGRLLTWNRLQRRREDAQRRMYTGVPGAQEEMQRIAQRIRDSFQDPNELTLFHMLQGSKIDDVPPDLGFDAESIPRAEVDERGIRMSQRGHGGELGMEEGGAAEGGGEGTGVKNVKQDLLDLERYMREIEQFIKAYRNQNAGIADTFNKYYEPLEANYQALNYTFKNKETPSWLGAVRAIPDPETDENFLKVLNGTKDSAEKVKKGMAKVDAEKLDITKEKGKEIKPTWRFISLSDVMTLWNNGVEDITDMWKRRTDRLVKEVGRPLFAAARKTGIWYADGLWAYHEKRYSGTETEAAHKWEEGLKNEDSHNILHNIIANATNHDQVRGAITLLCSRGEMDWNDEHAWDTLIKLSGLPMPKGPCRRSDILRDTWLKRMTSKIWGDKELYYHWRTDNDGKIESGKNSFTATVDQYSNTHRGMEESLRTQLRLWVESKKAGIQPPEEVKPHLYEKIIEYSIKNGKMSMEEKFFYLVQGVRHKLLSVDRLKTLAGEKGGLLLIFPAIDYFYKKNNSQPDLDRIGRQIQEGNDDGVGGDPFKPGLKTTFWLQFEVFRDQSARYRIAKGVGRKAEEMDHEDIPFVISALNYGQASGLCARISGDRFKMTAEGRKNVYVGFNAKFKAFAALLKLEGKKLDNFTLADAKHMAETLTTYIHVDNIQTNNANAKPDGLNIGQLKESDFSDPCPSGVGPTTGQYRNVMNSFVQRILTSQIGAEINLGTYKDGDQIKKLELKDYAAMQGQPFQRNKKEEKQIAVYQASGEFSKQLSNAAQKHLGLFKQILTEFLEGQEHFLDIDGSEINQASIDEYIRGRQAA